MDFSFQQQPRPCTSARFAAAIIAAVAGCGARSDLDTAGETNGEPGLSGGAGGSVACGGDPCDLTRGTFRIEAADGAPLGHLFLFDAMGTCGGSSQHYLIALNSPSGTCVRNGDYRVDFSAYDRLAGSADNLGGSSEPECGGLPWDETIKFDLRRVSCAEGTFDLSLSDSDPSAPYHLTARATRCRCDIGWVACKEPAPDDPCAP